jgi:hypothetical protein
LQTTRGLLTLPFHDHSLPNTEGRRMSESR